MSVAGAGVGVAGEVRMSATDEAVCALAQSGDNRAVDQLMSRYDRLATGMALDYFLPGGDLDDLRQEARVGLITALKTARRFKHRVLDESVRIGASESGEQIAVIDLLPSPLCRDPLLVLCEKEYLAGLLLRIRDLSPLERRSVMGIADGLSYAQISEALGGVTNKAIDNATQRARHKLRDAA